jgi:hypothetical protein
MHFGVKKINKVHLIISVTISFVRPFSAKVAQPIILRITDNKQRKRINHSLELISIELGICRFKLG